MEMTSKYNGEPVKIKTLIDELIRLSGLISCEKIDPGTLDDAAVGRGLKQLEPAG